VQAVGQVVVAAGCEFDLLLNDLERPHGSGLGLMGAQGRTGHARHRPERLHD
jgi:hypothetical protein